MKIILFIFFLFKCIKHYVVRIGFNKNMLKLSLLNKSNTTRIYCVVTIYCLIKSL